MSQPVTRTSNPLPCNTPDKRLVWLLAVWAIPNLGPASAFQLLDEGDHATLQR